MPMARDRAGTRCRRCARRVQKIPANATLPPQFALAPPVTRLAPGRKGLSQVARKARAGLRRASLNPPLSEPPPPPA